ncbi:cation-transporting P-type ATPase, partial [Porphyromonas loveana]|uniref:cation-transporting P-type ATPase n=1 Tax=Porphyromonas loveana TaxID=1884669 RepID=UPI0035A06835
MHISTERLDKKSPSTHSGLSDGEVLQSRATHGSNALTPPEKESLWSKFVSKFKDPIILIL